MIEILGWTSTILVLIGYVTNASGFAKTAMVTWILGDTGWIIYDLYIQNISHMVLSLVIITINMFGIYRLWKNSLQKTKSQNV
jgi:uncharacterized membrane protein YozB (DUF420 family)